jgi:S1-C subfamily serine protease
MAGCRIALCFIAAIMGCALANSARGDDGATTRPLFEELNRETQSLFKQVSGSVARVELPSQISRDDPLAKWAVRLDPDSWRRLQDMQRHATGSSFITTEIQPTTAPSDNPLASNEQQHIILMQMNRFTPNGIGIVVDDQGHLLVPRFADKDSFTGPVPTILANGQVAWATFVGSDEQTDVTLLKLNIKAAPVAVMQDRPELGSLMLVMSLNPALNRLAVWEGWEPDFAALMTIDGHIAGFSKGGHFVSAAAYLPVVSELIDHGKVQRAFLGVLIEPLPREDAQRMNDPALGGQPALRILEVFAGSAADRAGLQRGDLILTLAGESVGDAPAFGAAIASRRGKTEMTLLRNSEKITVNVDLEVQ